MSKSTGLLACTMFLATLFAGCTGGGDATDEVDVGPRPVLQAGKGAIAGLLIDDVYRPIPGALVLLQELGLTATTNAEGAFTFVDLTPGTYLLRVSATAHEAAPINVDVAAGLYAETEVVARRVFSQDGVVLTAEFSAFIPCAADFVVNGVVANCLLDLSGDSYRAGFVTKNLTYPDITYLVTEARVNSKGDYNVQVREHTGSPGGGKRYAVGQIKDGTYIRMINEYNVTNTEHNQQENNVPWTGDKPFMTIIFYQGAMRDELRQAGSPFCCGVGAQFGIKAKFVQTIFLGPPPQDIQTYCVLSSDCKT